ncbi:hypothetical protein SAMN05421837_113181 [Amycolatopsis pretoriensis]|uniref:Uncharacterized protein n=1 Tax=Amycolatopsis pretoriensis TaxID=218821 RepID=A0A1H5RG42_9PSEU|nr:hypothetical protein [Amycolatopsis pretoriensis]SEF37353.1 hypothetical protein SAMN05421837_113181 [Amycolatopsis pretoriensis]
MTTPGDLPRTPLSRLLDEISWEGRSVVKYRDGGRGKENVLTAEVLTALDYLPRSAYLGNVLRHAHGAAAAVACAADEAENAEIVFLPDEYVLSRTARGKAELIVQPDATITTPSSLVLVEAKAIRAGSFGPEQLAREYFAVTAAAGERTPLLLLVLGTAPPVAIRGRSGRFGVAEAVAANLEAVYAKAGPHPWPLDELRARVPESCAWLTWAEVADLVTAEHARGRHSGTFAAGTVDRLVGTVGRAVRWHG